jgi:hypothetical protein
MNYFGRSDTIHRAVSEIMKSPRGDFEYALFPLPLNSFGRIPGDFKYNYYPNLPVKSYSFGRIPGDFKYNYYPIVSYGKKVNKPAKKTIKRKTVSKKTIKRKKN